MGTEISILWRKELKPKPNKYLFPEEPRMVLVGRGEMIPGDPESKGIHTHLPDYSVRLHFSLASGRIWSGLLMSPQSLQKSWQREITVETQEGVSWHYSQGSHWRFLPLQPVFLWASGSPGRKGKCCIWTVEGPRVRHWHGRTRPATTPSFPGLTLWRITEVDFEWILPFLAEVCSVRGSQSSILQSYRIMPSFWISSFSHAHFPILLGDLSPIAVSHMSCSRPVRSESGALRGTKGKRFR